MAKEPIFGMHLDGTAFAITPVPKSRTQSVEITVFISHNVRRLPAIFQLSGCSVVPAPAREHNVIKLSPNTNSAISVLAIYCVPR